MRDRTHWFGCWKVHHECALGRIEQLEKALDKIESVVNDEVGIPATQDFRSRLLYITKSMKERQ